MSKRILCYGASNTWGFKPNSFNPKTGLAERYARHERWPSILAKELHEFEIIEEGLNGRTTMFDDAIAQKPYRNGLTQLPIILESHYPIDLVIFMLGTNDLKTQYDKSIDEISNGMKYLIDIVMASNKGPYGSSPKVLVIAPQPILREGLIHPTSFDNSSIQKSHLLSEAYEKVCAESGCFFLDASKFIKSSLNDGIHLDISEHRKLAEALKNKLQVLYDPS